MQTNNLATSFSPCIRRGKRARARAGGAPWGCWAGGSGCCQWVSVPEPAPGGLHKCLVAGVCSLHCQEGKSHRHQTSRWLAAASSALWLCSALPCLQPGPSCQGPVTLSVPPGFGCAAGAACQKSAPKLSPGSWWCRRGRGVMGWRGQSRALPVPLLRVARSVGRLALGQERASHLSSSSCQVNKSLRGNYFCQEPNISLERGK